MTFDTDSEQLLEIERMLDSAKVPNADFDGGEPWSTRDRVFALIMDRDKAERVVDRLCNYCESMGLKVRAGTKVHLEQVYADALAVHFSKEERIRK
jgi:hypothetical protein